MLVMSICCHSGAVIFSKAQSIVLYDELHHCTCMSKPKRPLPASGEVQACRCGQVCQIWDDASKSVACPV